MNLPATVFTIFCVTLSTYYLQFRIFRIRIYKTACKNLIITEELSCTEKTVCPVRHIVQCASVCTPGPTGTQASAKFTSSHHYTKFNCYFIDFLK